MTTFDFTGDWLFTQQPFQIGTTEIATLGGATGSFIVLQAITSLPSSAITANYGIIAVDPISNNLFYYNSTGSVQLNGPVGGTVGWLTAGNAGVGSGGVIGNLDPFPVSVITAGIPAISIDIAQNVEIGTSTSVTKINNILSICNTLPGSFGGLTGNALILQNVTASPSLLPSGYGALYPDSSGNLFFTNSIATYQLTPLQSTGWLTSGNTGLTSPTLGTNDAVSWSIVYNSLPYINFATTYLTLNAEGLILNNVPIAITTEVLYFNSMTNQVTYGSVGSSFPGVWNTIGNSGLTTPKLGTTDAIDWSIVHNGSSYITLTATNLTLNSAGLILSALPPGVTLDVLYFNSSTNQISYGSPGGSGGGSNWNTLGNSGLTTPVLGTNDAVNWSAIYNGSPLINFSSSGLSLISASLFLTSLPLATAANVLYYNSSTHQVTYDVAGGGGGGSNWTTIGNSGLVSPTLGTLDLVSWTIIANNTPYISIDPSSNLLSLNSILLKLTSLPNAVTGDVLYYNPGTNQITFGTSAGGGSGWSLSGNTLSTAGLLGSLNSFNVDMICNSISYVHLDPVAQTITINNHVSGYHTNLNGDLITSSSNSFTINAFTSFNVNTGTIILTANTGAATINLESDTSISMQSPLFALNSYIYKIKNLTVQNASGTYKSIIYQSDPLAADAFEIYYGDGGGTGGAAWELIGNSSVVSGKLGTLDASAWTAIYDNTSYLTFDSSGLTVNSAGLFLSSIPSAIAGNVLYYDSTSKVVSYGAGGGGGGGWLTVGNSSLSGGILGTLDNQDWTVQRNGDVLATYQSGLSTFDVTGVVHLYKVNCTEINIGKTSGCNLYFSGDDIQSEGNTVRLDNSFGGSFYHIGTINCSNMVIGNSSNVAMSIAATTLNINASTSTTVNAANLLLQSVPSLATANVLYYNSGTGRVTFGAAGGGGSGWALSANNLSGGELFGSLNAFDVVMVANNVEVARLVNSDGTFQINANNTFLGSDPISIIQGSAAGGFLALTATPFSAGAPTGATVLLGGATNPDLGNGIALYAPSSSIIFIGDLMTGPYGLVGAPGILLGGGDLTDFGDATKNVITLGKQTTNPTTVGSGLGTIFVGTDNNLYFLNNTSTYQLTPPSGGGSSWLLSGNTLGGTGFKIGSNDNFAWDAVANGVSFINFNPSSHTLTLYSTGAGTTTAINGNTVLISSNAGGITIDGIVSSSTFISIGNTNAISVSIGRTGQVTGLASNEIYLPNIPALIGGSVPLMWDPSTKIISFGSGGGGSGWNLTGTNSGGGLTLGTNTTDSYSLVVNSVPGIEMDLGSVSVGTNVGIGVVNIGMPTAHLNIFSPLVYFPNLASGANADVVYYNSTNGQFTFAAAGGGGSGWNLTGTNTGSGNTLGLSDTNTWSIVQGGQHFITLSTNTLNIADNSSGVTNFTLGSATCTFEIDCLRANWNIGGVGSVNFNISSNASFQVLGADAAFVIFDIADGEVNINCHQQMTFGSAGTGFGSINIGNNNRAVAIEAQNLSLGASLGLDMEGQSMTLGFYVVSASTLQIANSLVTTTLDGTNLIIPNLPSATPANILYIDPSTNIISQGLAPGGGGVGWLVGGNVLVADSVFGSTTSGGFSIISKTNGVTYQTIDSGNEWDEVSTHWSHNSTGAIDFHANQTLELSATSGGSFNVGGLLDLSGSSFDIRISGLARLSLNGSGDVTFAAIRNFAITMTGALTINGLAAGTQSDVLAYNTSTFAVTHTPIAALISTSAWNLAATNSGSGLKLGTNSTDGYNLVVNSVPFIALSPGVLNIGNDNSIVLSVGNSANLLTLGYNGISAIGAGNINFQTPGDITFTSTGGTLTYDALAGVIQIGAHGNPTSIVIGAGVATVTTLQGDVTNIFGTTSIDIDSASIVIGDISCASLTLANSAASTFLLLQTPAIVNNTPLLIDTNGFIHV